VGHGTAQRSSASCPVRPHPNVCARRSRPRTDQLATRGIAYRSAYTRGFVTGTLHNEEPGIGMQEHGLVTLSRHLLARHIVGAGVELGPGHVPFPLGPGTQVRYIDRWQPDENHELFPELADATFPVPHIVADLNTDRLRALPDASQDFVICSHVLEHVAEPIGLLEEIHRVLRLGGVVLILLPDRHRTFDRHRDRTPVAHLVAEFEAGVTEVDDDHVTEYMEKTGLPLGESPAERRANIDRELRRSIHVHCWDDREFVPVLLHCIEQLSQRWEFVDGAVADDEGPAGFEFGFVLRRCAAGVDPAVLLDRFETSWRIRRDARPIGSTESYAEAAELRARVAELEADVAARQARLDRIDRSLPMRAYRVVKRVLAPR
jgi:SAM-dependent methyltransferase